MKTPLHQPARAAARLLASACLLAVGALGAEPAAAQAPSATVRKDAAHESRSRRHLNDLGASSAVRRRAALAWLADHGRHQEAIQVAPLLRDDDEQNREIAEHAMWQMWGRTGDARFDRRFARAVDQMNSGDFRGAVEVFGALIRERPDLAEAWNKRATAYFMIGEFDKSLADCEEVIRRNPAHFGVLSGFGQIHARQGNLEQALEYFERALQVNPNMAGVAANIRGLRLLIDEKRRNST